MIVQLTILGIDPGSRRTGYGVVRVDGAQVSYVASGCIAPKGAELAARLKEIYDGVSVLLDEYRPDAAAIEQVFMAQNPRSALTLGQARGVAMAALMNRDLQVSEYAARQVKQAVVGTGKADKRQIQHMMQVLLSLSGLPQADAADALAIALCHVNTAVLSEAGRSAR